MDMEHGGGFPRWGMHLLVDISCILKDGRPLNLPGNLLHSQHCRYLITDSPVVRSIVSDLESWHLFSRSTRAFPWCPGAFQWDQAQAITFLPLCYQGTWLAHVQLAILQDSQGLQSCSPGCQSPTHDNSLLVCSRCRTLHLSFWNFLWFLLTPSTSLGRSGCQPFSLAYQLDPV